MRRSKTSVDTLKNAAMLFMTANTTDPIRVHLCVDTTAPDFIIATVKELFIPADPSAQLRILNVDSAVDSPVGMRFETDCDVCFVLCGHHSQAAAHVVVQYQQAPLPCAVIARSSVEAPYCASDPDGSAVGLVTAADAATLKQKLASWVVDALAEKGIAFARAFTFARKAKVNQLVHSCALQNAAVGALVLIPGADMPVMTTNQMRLALDIARVYGHEQDLSRVGDIVAVVGAGLVYRGAARALLSVVPVVGAVVKASVGFGGTISTGRVLAARFEQEDRTQ